MRGCSSSASFTRAQVAYELERDALLELGALAFGEVHDAHTASAKLPNDPERAGVLWCSVHRRRIIEQNARQLNGRRLEEPARAIVRVEQ